MSLFAALPVIASMGMGFLGQKEEQKGYEKGLKSQYNIEKMKREFAEKTFAKTIERQRPFVEAGERALLLSEQAGSGAALETGLAKSRARMVGGGVGSMSDYVKNLSARRGELGEEERYKGRLQDLQRIGLGAAGATGQAGQRLSGTIAESQQRVGGIQANLAQSKGMQRQNMWLQAADALSGLPAYASSLNRGGGKTPQQRPTGLPMNTNYGGYA